jgi:hypothetical protein
LNFKLLHVLFGTQQITLAMKAEFKYAFQDCEVGALPPFGNLYDMEVLLPNHWQIRYLTIPAKDGVRNTKKTSREIFPEGFFCIQV